MIKSFLIINLITIPLLFCPSSDQRCASCVLNSCVVCYDSYLDTTGRCRQSTTRVDRCLEYVNDGRCKFCQHGYYADVNGSCQRIQTANCVEVSPQNSNQCVMCDKNILIQNGQCNKDNKCDIENCDFCLLETNGQRKCSLCRGGYVLKSAGDSNVCVREIDSNRNCYFVDINNNCLVCDINSYMSNGRCIDSDVYDLRLGAGIFEIVSFVTLIFLA